MGKTGRRSANWSHALPLTCAAYADPHPAAVAAIGAATKAMRWRDCDKRWVAESHRIKGITLARQADTRLMQCSIPAASFMKLIGFWLLIVLAVLVPATASVATSMFCPTVSVAKAKGSPDVVVARSVGRHAALFGGHAKASSAKVVNKKTVPAEADVQSQHCCEASPCSHCTSCGSCVSMVTQLALDTAGHPLVESVLPERSSPRAEFLLSGQERPPRTA